MSDETNEYAKMTEAEKRAYRKEIFEELEAMGLLERNGKFRRGPITGEMQPVYVWTELGKRVGPVLPDDETFAELEALGLIKRIGSYVSGDELKPRFVLTELGRKTPPERWLEDEQ